MFIPRTGELFFCIAIHYFDGASRFSLVGVGGHLGKPQEEQGMCQDGRKVACRIEEIYMPIKSIIELFNGYYTGGI